MTLEHIKCLSSIPHSKFYYLYSSNIGLGSSWAEEWDKYNSQHNYSGTRINTYEDRLIWSYNVATSNILAKSAFMFLAQEHTYIFTRW